MRKKGRTRKEQKARPGEAARQCIRKAYTSYDVAGYIAKKYNIKKEVEP